MNGPNELLSRLYGTTPGQSKTASAPRLQAGNDPLSKEAAARFAEDDFRGRVMAHAFWQERQKIAEEMAGGPPPPPEAGGGDPGLPPELMAQLQAAGITPEQFMQMVAEQQAGAGGAPPEAGPPPGPPEEAGPPPPDAPEEEKAAYAAYVDREAQKLACVELDSRGVNPFTLAPYRSEQEKVAAFNQFQEILAQERAQAVQNDVHEKTASYVNTVLAGLGNR